MMDNILRCIEHAGVKLYAILHTLLGWVVAGLLFLADYVGITMSVNNASSVVDNSNYASINVPGPNLGSGVVVGTTEQVRLSQKVAIKAYKEGEYFVNANLTENT